MSSDLQIQVNRRNSQKSTGPRTAAGKAASSLNHTTSGIYAESQIVIGERQSDLQDLATAFYARFQPDAPEQRTLLDIMIHSEWLLRRLRRAETGLWDTYIDEYGNGNDTNDLGRAFNCRDKTLARLQRRLDSVQRNFEHAHKELKRLQADRPAAAQPAPEPISAPKPVTQESAIGFIPSVTQAVKPPAPQAPAPVPPANFGFVPSITRPAAPRLPPVTMETPCPLPVISTPSPESAATCWSAH
jgi:hypothetical protein